MHTRYTKEIETEADRQQTQLSEQKNYLEKQQNEMIDELSQQNNKQIQKTAGQVTLHLILRAFSIAPFGSDTAKHRQIQKTAGQVTRTCPLGPREPVSTSAEASEKLLCSRG